MLLIFLILGFGIIAAFQGFMWSQATQGFKVASGSPFTLTHLVILVNELVKDTPGMAPSETPIYLGTAAGLLPAGAVYLAVLNGKKSLVLDAQEAHGTNQQSV